MDLNYEFLLEDLHISQKTIGTDKGLAKIGDGLVNLAYSLAKSIYLTKNSKTNTSVRTGEKVSKKILANALKNAEMKDFAKNRADAHDMADTVEAIIAYLWLKRLITLDEVVSFLQKRFEGNLYKRREESESAIEAFTELLLSLKKHLPENIL
jgi:ectoine hydroxylase-related dioxygenase (phytanoyl-CoA dioxygenase family)